MKVSVELEGQESLSRLFKRAGDGNRRALAQAIFKQANVVLNESKELVPVDNGDLKKSGKVENPKITATNIEVEISYGGDARAYAWIVHEDPNAQHKDGQTYKYLEIPVNNNKDKFVDEVKKMYFTYLRRG